MTDRGTESLDEPFRMVGTRELLQLLAEADTFRHQLDAIEIAMDRTPPFAIDLAKALVETACRTILADRGQTLDDDSSTNKLVSGTLKFLNSYKEDHPEQRRLKEAFDKTTKGLALATVGLTEMRNASGIASHGRDAYAQTISKTHAGFAARAADAVVAFIYRIHREKPSDQPAERVYYEDHEAFNQDLDDNVGIVKIGNAEYKPSRILFELDIDAYRTAAWEFLDQPQNDDDEASEA